MHRLTVREALQRASSFLSEAGIKEPSFTAEYLIRSYLKWDRTRFILELSTEITAQDWAGIERWLNRCVRGEPIQYIVGEQEFFGEVFVVQPGVLIPRPETEQLVEQVLIEGDRIWGKDTPIKVIDLGTGSGAIPITIAKQRPHWEIWAVDLSIPALRIARSNAERLGVDERINFIRGDMLNIIERFKVFDVEHRFHMVISNPPYIPTKNIAELQIEVKGHEPLMALDGGEDGLHFYRGIIRQLPALLLEGGLVAFEVGIHQAQQVVQLLQQTNLKETRILSDFQAIERIILGYS